MAQENETAKEPEGDSGGETDDELLWVCPWCGVDQRSKATYYRHLKKCDKCPEDQVDDKNRTPAHVAKKEEPFVINIFESPPEDRRPPKVVETSETAEKPPVKPHKKAPEKEEEEAKPPEEEEEKPAKKPADNYKCGACGAESSTKFRFCPECGVENEWPE